MNAAGVLSDVAADGAGRLAGRIGNVVKAKVGDCARDVRIYNARLNDGDAIRLVNLQDPAHARQLNHDALI
jgi:hypothetical protein